MAYADGWHDFLTFARSAFWPLVALFSLRCLPRLLRSVRRGFRFSKSPRRFRK